MDITLLVLNVHRIVCFWLLTFMILVCFIMLHLVVWYLKSLGTSMTISYLIISVLNSSECIFEIYN